MKKGIVCQEIRTEIRTGQLDNDYRLKSCKVNKIRVVEYRKQPAGWNSKEIVSRGTNILPGISNKSWEIHTARLINAQQYLWGFRLSIIELQKWKVRSLNGNCSGI